MYIRDNLLKIQSNLDNNVRVIAVSKTRPATVLAAAIKLGQKDFGENYLQEALKKIQILKEYNNIVWHFIGPIQSNKTSLIAKNFTWVHSIDRLKIARKLNDQRPKSLGKLKICIQVNIDNEATKSGILVEELDYIINSVREFKNLSLEGLMCIPSKNNTKNTFKKMQKLKEKHQLKELSMGMSNDFVEAIKNGATMVRIGSAIFGNRN